MRIRPFLTAFLVLAVLAVSGASLRAAELPPQLSITPEAQADAFLQGLSGRLALTPQEMAAMRPILIEQAGKRQALVRAHMGSGPGMSGALALRQEMRKLGQETDSRLAALLPPDKLAVVRAYQKERREEIRAKLTEARKTRAGG
uniref:P pilus assembly/Cpx signaling pathway, periplasmic inhibitor/zinc-resistance associated protein n=1 Tax=Desulfovibrio sp. U5L TaxID=596152 RepID=I2Q422_9BACT